MDVESTEFSTLIEELLNEDDKMLRQEKDTTVSSEDNDFVVTDKKEKNDVHNKSVADSQTSSFSQKLWCHWLQRDFVRNTAILAVLFVLITSPFFLSICHV